jgi:hypothetical protein
LLNRLLLLLRVERLLHLDVRLYLGCISGTGKVVATYDVVVDVNFDIASSRSCLGCGCRRSLHSYGEVPFEQGIFCGHTLDVIRDHLCLNWLRYLHRLLLLKLEGRFVDLPRL